MNIKTIVAVIAVVAVVIGVSAFAFGNGPGDQDPETGTETYKYRLTFEANDSTGTAPADIDVNAGDSFTMPENTFTHKDDGYNTWYFTGWQNMKTGGIYEAGQTVTVDASFEATLWDTGMRFVAVFDHDGSDIMFVSVTERDSFISNSAGCKVDERHLAFCQTGTDAVTYYPCDLEFYYTLPNPGEDTCYYGWAFTIDGVDDSPEFCRITITLIASASDAPSGTTAIKDGVYMDTDADPDSATVYVVEKTPLTLTFSDWEEARTYDVAQNDGTGMIGVSGNGEYVRLLTAEEYGLEAPEGATFIGWTRECGNTEATLFAGDYVENHYASFYAVWSS